MIRILTFSLSLYWLAFFGSHAVAALMASQYGLPSAFSLLNSGFPGVGQLVAGSPAVSLGFACLFFLAAAMFLWMLLASLLSKGERSGQFQSIANHTTSLAGIALAFMFVAATFNPSAELFQSISLHVAGLAGSYAAISVEFLTQPSDNKDGEMADLARVKALQATHSALLSRISGREPAGPKEFG